MTKKFCKCSCLYPVSVNVVALMLHKNMTEKTHKGEDLVGKSAFHTVQDFKDSRGPELRRLQRLAEFCLLP